MVVKRKRSLTTQSKAPTLAAEGLQKVSVYVKNTVRRQ
jgi:hypothetical protein